MQSKTLVALGVALTAAMSTNSAAQEVRSFRVEPGRGFSFSTGDNENRAVIGVSTSTGSRRDTLGVLVSSVTPKGPAEKAGIEEGNRIAAINGVNLKLSVADIDDEDMSGLMSRRLTRELGKVKPGDEVELRVYASGQVKTMKIKTIAYDSLYRSMFRDREDVDERAGLGVSLGSSGSRRDTLGVLVMWVNDSGPAAKAGIEEGSRIASINGVDLRVSREDAGDDMISSAKVQRLQRELNKLKIGDDADLRVYADGKWRNVKVKTVSMAKLNRSGRSRAFIWGDGSGMSMPRVPMTPMPPLMATPAPRVRITRITM